MESIMPKSARDPHSKAQIFKPKPYEVEELNREKTMKKQMEELQVEIPKIKNLREELEKELEEVKELKKELKNKI